MADISFTKVSLPYGWLGNMAPYPIVHRSKTWRTSEALFQSMRFEDETVIELIRSQASPMAAKMKAKAHAGSRTVDPMSSIDVENMWTCLKLKFDQHADLREKLIRTGDHNLIEDIGKRRGERHEFWGAYKSQEGQWIGLNVMGRLLMELRKKMSK